MVFFSKQPGRSLTRRFPMPMKKAKKMKPVMVPVATVPKAYFDELTELRVNQFGPVGRKTEKKKKWRIYKLVPVNEFRATEEDAQKELDKIRAKARKGTLYWLDDVPPRRLPPIRVT